MKFSFYFGLFMRCLFTAAVEIGGLFYIVAFFLQFFGVDLIKPTKTLFLILLFLCFLQTVLKIIFKLRGKNA